jgi:acyl carrier protein
MPAVTTEAVKNRISSSLRVPLAKLGDDTPVTDVVTESFAIVEMVIDLQEEFGIKLGQEDLKTIKTFGALARIVVERARSASG